LSATLTSDTNVADLLRDSPLADESAVAGVQTSVEDVIASSAATAAAGGSAAPAPAPSEPDAEPS